MLVGPHIPSLQDPRKRFPATSEGALKLCDKIQNGLAHPPLHPVPPPSARDATAAGMRWESKRPRSSSPGSGPGEGHRAASPLQRDLTIHIRQ